MTFFGATLIGAIATAALAVLAFFTALYARRAYLAQSAQLADQRKVNAEQTSVLKLQAQELRASLDARQQESLVLRQQYASTIVAWQDEPQSYGPSWLVAAHVLNTGERPVRDVSVRWYADGKPIQSREDLTACLMPKDRKNFDCRVGGATLRAGLKAIVQFRTVGEDWWSAGTDGSLAGGMEVADMSPLAAEGDTDRA